MIGVDGMDPGFVERHWANLPNLARLRERGSFSRLQTTTPPQSPVAWSTFITGLDPAGHGIYDFVHRDPATLQPFLSMGKTEPARFHIPLGPYVLPLLRSHVVSLRKGQAFWEIMAKHEIPVTIIRIPANYPPVNAGNEISGMGMPDLRGTEGTFAFFTDDPGETPREVPGGLIFRAEVMNGRATLAIPGPPDSLRRDNQASSAEMDVDVDPERPFARIKSGDTIAIIREGQWSKWLTLDFPLIPHLASVHGMVRVYAKQLHPGFELYVSPVNVDPKKPSLPISAPPSFSSDVAKRAGRFYTVGIPEDTSAMRQGVFNLDEFLGQSRLVLDDELRLLDDSLDRFHNGFLFFYFSSVDENSHMLWGQHDDQLLRIYRMVDRAIGEVSRRKPMAELMVMSDHGFTSFSRAVNLNKWLNQQGWLEFEAPPDKIAWPRTKAYAMGLNGLYLNLAGREAHGIVPAAKRDALLQEIRQGLLNFRDPENGRKVVEAVAITKDSPFAPDMIVGYAPGYRASWETGLGGSSTSVIEDNNDAWIADHCINPDDVPGVLFTTRKISLANPRLKDLPVSLLAEFGIPAPSEMSGHALY